MSFCISKNIGLFPSSSSHFLPFSPLFIAYHMLCVFLLFLSILFSPSFSRSLLFFQVFSIHFQSSRTIFPLGVLLSHVFPVFHDSSVPFPYIISLFLAPLSFPSPALSYLPVIPQLTPRFFLLIFSFYCFLCRFSLSLFLRFFPSLHAVFFSLSLAFSPGSFPSLCLSPYYSPLFTLFFHSYSRLSLCQFFLSFPSLISSFPFLSRALYPSLCDVFLYIFWFSFPLSLLFSVLSPFVLFSLFSRVRSAFSPLLLFSSNVSFFSFLFSLAYTSHYSCLPPIYSLSIPSFYTSLCAVL